MDKKICGTELDKIRKHYFKGKIDKLLNDMQAEGDYSAEEYEKLKEYLSTLQKKDRGLSANFSSFLPQIDNEPDTVLDELNKESLSEAEIAQLDKEKSNREAAVNFASKMLKSLFVRFASKEQNSPGEDELMDTAFEMLGLEYYLIRDALYKERIYRKRIVEFERMGKQRKLAEELAKTETPYREYMLAEGLKDMAQELINLAKKRYRNL